VPEEAIRISGKIVFADLIFLRPSSAIIRELPLARLDHRRLSLSLSFSLSFSVSLSLSLSLSRVLRKKQTSIVFADRVDRVDRRNI